MRLFLFLLGLALAIISHPKILNRVVARLFNEGLLTPRRYAPEKVELVRFAGPNLSLFALGIILMLLSIALRSS